MPRITPLVKPSRIFHDVCAYWLTSSAGFKANAPGHHASSVHASATTFRFLPSALHMTSTFYRKPRKPQSSPALKPSIDLRRALKIAGAKLQNSTFAPAPEGAKEFSPGCSGGARGTPQLT